MIQLRRLTRIKHAVSDRQAAEAFYQQAFGARLFFEGDLEAEGRSTRLYIASNFVMEAVSGDEPDAARFLERYGQRLYAVCLTVDDLDDARRHLQACGVGATQEGPRLLATDPRGTFGVRYELTDREVPGDPRLEPDWSTAWWAEEHPLGLLGFWSVTTIVPDAEKARRFYLEAFGAEDLYTREGVVASRKTVFLGLGNAILGLLEPPDSGVTDLTRVSDIQGIEGIHALSIQVKDFGMARRHFAAMGIGLIGKPEYYVMPHPRMSFGARYMLGRGLRTDDAFMDIRRRYLEGRR